MLWWGVVKSSPNSDSCAGVPTCHWDLRWAPGGSYSQQAGDPSGLPGVCSARSRMGLGAAPATQLCTRQRPPEMVAAQVSVSPSNDTVRTLKCDSDVIFTYHGIGCFYYFCFNHLGR